MKPREDGKPKTMLYKYPGVMLTHGVKKDGVLVGLFDFDYIVVPSVDTHLYFNEGWFLSPAESYEKIETKIEAVENKKEVKSIEPVSRKDPEENSQNDDQVDLDALISEVKKMRGRNITDRMVVWAAKHGIELDDTNNFFGMKSELINALRIKYGMDKG